MQLLNPQRKGFLLGVAACAALSTSMLLWQRRRHRRRLQLLREKSKGSGSEAVDASKIVVQALNGSAICLCLSVGHQLGLFDALADAQELAESGRPSGHRGLTIAEFASHTGLNDRYLQEWLGVLTTAGVVQLEGGADSIAQGRYSLPPSAIACLTKRAGMNNMGVYTQEIPMLTQLAPQIIRCFKEGGGIGYERQPPEFFSLMQEMGAAKIATGWLVDVFVPCVPGLAELLASPPTNREVHVLEVGCGRGGACVLALAAAFPSVSFTGCDVSEREMEACRIEAQKRGLSNACFVAFDAADQLPSEWTGRFDWILANDVVHDLARPEIALANLRNALRPLPTSSSSSSSPSPPAPTAASGSVSDTPTATWEATLSVVDVGGSSTHRGNLRNGFAPFLYTVSLFHCMTVSLAQGGPGLGMCWGEDVATALLERALFRVDRREIPGDSFNCHFMCRPTPR